jgi:hypothetical protein
MITVRYNGRIGNQLFQYSLGRIIAHKLGYALSCRSISGLPSTEVPIGGLTYEEPLEILTGQAIPLRSVLQDTRARAIILDGYFQRAEFFMPYREQIRNWVLGDEERKIDPRRVVIHIRRTDYLDHKWELPFHFYREALKAAGVSGRDIWICTDDSKDPFLRRFASYHPKIFQGDEIASFHFMRTAGCLILSRSSFSWWAAFLAEGQSAFGPQPKTGFWSKGDEREEGISLVDQNLFQCIEFDEMENPTLRELFYSRTNWFSSSLAAKLRRVSARVRANFFIPKRR